MDGYWTFVLIFIMILASSKDCSGQKTLNIRPFPIALVTEEGSVIFTCTYSNILGVCLSESLFTWFLNNNQTLLLAWRKNACVFGDGNAALNYTCSIAQNICEITLTLTLTQVQRQQHGDVWGCRIDNMQKDSTIFVNVPITSVDVASPTTSPVIVSENSSLTFVCETSAGRPKATIHWYKQLETYTAVSIHGGIISTIQSGTLVITKSTLHFTPTRSDHDYRVYCTAYNTDVSSTYTSNNKPHLYVQYAPDTGPVLEDQTDGNTFYILNGKPQRLTCSIEGGRPLASLSWTCFSGVVQDQSTESTTQQQVTWTAARAHDGHVCTCQASHPVWTSIRPVFVTSVALYPPTSPTFTVQSQSVSATVFVIEGTSVSVICSSTSNPPPVYSWTPRGYSPSSGILTLTSVKTSDNGVYTCTVTNTMTPTQGVQESGFSSASIILNVLFPPRAPVLRYSTTGGPIISSVFNVVRGDSFSILCSAEGNPEPSYQWSSQSANNNRLTVTGIHTDTSWTCTATNEMVPTGAATHTGSSTATATANVLYGPSTPKLTYHNSSRGPVSLDNGLLHVLRRNSFIVTCDGSDSKPPSEYKWSGSLTSPTGTLRVDNLKTTTSSTCTASNVMARTYGIEVVKSSRQEITIDVLYSPTIPHLFDETAVENGTFSKDCMVTPGNPASTEIKWITFKNKTIFNGQALTIGKVTRDSAGTYRCTARNTMQPTGEPAVDGTDSATFILTVYYPASITEFTVNDAKGDGPFIYNENTTITISCVVDSNPGSEILISRDDFDMDKVTNRRDNTHIIEEASCLDAGMYSCTAKNQYNGNSYSTISRQVYFRCPPRPVDSVNNYTYYVGLNDSVTLNLTVTAYPEPTYRWLKQEKEITVGVSKDGHRTNLTLEQITEDDLGQYKVVVTNSQGTLEHLFVVAAQEIAPVDNRESHSSASAIAGAVGGSAVALILIVIVIFVVRRYNCSKGLSRCLMSKSGTEEDQGDEINSHHVYVNTTASPDTTGSKDNIDRNMYEDLNMSHLQPQLYEQLQQGEQDETCDQDTDKRDAYETLDHGSVKPQLYDSLQHTSDHQTETSKVYENLRLS